MSTAASRQVSRWHVTSRVVAAILLGFILANTASVMLGFLVPMAKAEAVLLSLVCSFLVYTLIIIWIFSVKRLKTVWLGLLGGIVVSAGLSYVLYLLESSS
ncbi:MAG: hypothetical protein AAF438_03415 [Pseudomonadota bacterium]